MPKGYLDQLEEILVVTQKLISDLLDDDSQHLVNQIGTVRFQSVKELNKKIDELLISIEDYKRKKEEEFYGTQTITQLSRPQKFRQAVNKIVAVLQKM